MNAHQHNSTAAYGGNTHAAWPFFKASIADIPALPVIAPMPVPNAVPSAPVVIAASVEVPAPYAALHRVFGGDKLAFDAFIARSINHFDAINPEELRVKSNKAFTAAPARIQVNVFAGDKACRIAALRKALPDAIKKVFYGKGSKGFRTFVSMLGANELEAVAASIVPLK